MIAMNNYKVILISLLLMYCSSYRHWRLVHEQREKVATFAKTLDCLEIHFLSIHIPSRPPPF